MVSEYEALRLQCDMRHELDGSSRAVEKCAMGLALLALIAVMGAQPGRSYTPIDAAAAPVVVAGDELTPPLDWE